MNPTIKLIATDFDGTFLTDEKEVCSDNLSFLHEIGDQGIIRVAATGRSMFKVNEVIAKIVPFDYIVFSSGGGVFDWRTRKILTSEHLASRLSRKLTHYLLKKDLNFFLYKPIPNNNMFWFHRGAEKCHEFENYLDCHSTDHFELNSDQLPNSIGQMMVILPNDAELFESIKNEVYCLSTNVKVIRTTSPVNGNYIWLEIFPSTVSKAHGIKWICDQHKINYSQTIGIGNDYNDIDMLEFVQYPFVVANSMPELKQRFVCVDETNNQSAVSKVFSYL